MASLYRVYVLQNGGGKFYVGLSDDVARRVKQHDSDQSKYTKRKGPWTLRWTSEELSLSDARRLENRLKRQKGGIGFHLIMGLSRS